MKTNFRLIFHFYVFDGMQDSKVCNLHFACLSEYSKIFTESVFVLSIDDVNNTEALDYAKKRIIESGFVDNVKFIVVKNNEWQETGTFYDMVVKKLDDLDGLTFFAHSKGVGNERSGEFKMEEIYQWIIALYFLNLRYVDEVVHTLIRSPFLKTYGALKCSWEDIENKYRWIYSGTFFWMNTKRIYAYAQRHNIEIPTPHNRYYSECFLGDILEINYDSTSHGSWYLIGDNVQGWYHMASKYIDCYLLTDDDKKEYYEFKDKMLCRIK